MNLLEPQPSKRERALIGTDAEGTAIILATDGGWIASTIEVSTTAAADVGLVKDGAWLAPGLYLWEGAGALGYETHEATVPTEVRFRGSLRPVQPGEVAALYAMTPPEIEVPY